MGPCIEHHTGVNKYTIADSHIMAADKPYVRPYSALADIYPGHPEKADPEPAGKDWTGSDAVQPEKFQRPVKVRNGTLT
jgi:hypothetical protein